MGSKEHDEWEAGAKLIATAPATPTNPVAHQLADVPSLTSAGHAVGNAA